MKSVNTNIFTFVFISFVVLAAFFPLHIALALPLSMAFVLNFILKLYYRLDVRFLIITVAAVQWVLGSVLSYWFVPSDNVYAMKVDAPEYYAFILPALLVCAAGLFAPLGSTKLSKNELFSKIQFLLRKNANIDIILILAGMFFSVFEKMAPASLRFIVFLLSGIKYVGLLMLIINTQRKRRKLYLYISIIILLALSVLDGSFGGLTYWTVLMFMIYAYFVKFSLRQILIMGTVAVFGIMIMQVVKIQYREAVWFGGTNYSVTEKFELFRDLTEQQTQDGIANDEAQQSTISRINQGWIISHIMYNMNHGGEYLGGETIFRTVLSVILPGSLYEDKLKAGGQEYFTLFTGRRIGETTSMNISVLGEAYGNYGSYGGLVFMFIFGLFLNAAWLLTVKIIRKHPLMLFFVPMLFQQVIKAENDLFIVINHLIKAGLFVFVIYFTLSKFYNLKIKQLRSQ